MKKIVLALDPVRLEFIIDQLEYLAAMYQKTEDAHAGECPALESDAGERSALDEVVADLKLAREW